MVLTDELVKHVAALARLSLTPQEITRARGELQRVLDAVAELETLSLDDVPPTFQVNVRPSPPEKDEPKPPLGTEKALANAPAKVGTSFAVPRIID